MTVDLRDKPVRRKIVLLTRTERITEDEAERFEISICHDQDALEKHFHNGGGIIGIALCDDDMPLFESDDPPFPKLKVVDETILEVDNSLSDPKWALVILEILPDKHTLETLTIEEIDQYCLN